MKFGFRVISGFISLLFVGCTATALHPGAEKVIVSRAAAPKGCKFLGHLIGQQGGAMTGRMTSNKNLALGAMNDMKNQAHALGANYVVLEHSVAGQTTDGSWQYQERGDYGADWNRHGGQAYGQHRAEGEGHIHSGQTDMTHSGNAYLCSPTDIGLH